MIHPGWTPISLGTVTASAAPQGSSSWASLLNTLWWNAQPAASGPPPAPDDNYVDSFKWCDPLTFKDGEAGAVCEISGAWFPGHMLRTITDPHSEFYGKRVGAPFYPHHKAFPPAQPATWGEPSE